MQARLIYIQKYSTVEKFITNQDVRDIIYKSGIYCSISELQI